MPHFSFGWVSSYPRTYLFQSSSLKGFEIPRGGDISRPPPVCLGVCLLSLHLSVEPLNIQSNISLSQHILGQIEWKPKGIIEFNATSPLKVSVVFFSSSLKSLIPASMVSKIAPPPVSWRLYPLCPFWKIVVLLPHNLHKCIHQLIHKWLSNPQEIPMSDSSSHNSRSTYPLPSLSKLTP